MAAFRSAQAEAFRTTPWITAMVWTIGSTNPCDECLEHEGERYTSADQLPEQNLHPQCSCYWEEEALSADEWYSALEEYAEGGEDPYGIGEWLESM